MGEAVLIPGLGKSPGGGNGIPLQYSCLGNPMDRGALASCSPKGCKDLNTTVPVGMLYISMTEKALCFVFSLQMY